jgi:hypothetical protein
LLASACVQVRNGGARPQDDPTAIDAASLASIFDARPVASPVSMTSRASFSTCRCPGNTGVQAAKAIWADNPAMSIIFWSKHADEACGRGVARMVPHHQFQDDRDH